MGRKIISFGQALNRQYKRKVVEVSDVDKRKLFELARLGFTPGMISRQALIDYESAKAFVKRKGFNAEYRRTLLAQEGSLPKEEELLEYYKLSIFQLERIKTLGKDNKPKSQSTKQFAEDVKKNLPVTIYKEESSVIDPETNLVDENKFARTKANMIDDMLLAAKKLVDSINNMTDSEVSAKSLGERVKGVGTLIDKVMKLAENKDIEKEVQDAASDLLSMIGKTIPMRKKDQAYEAEVILPANLKKGKKGKR